MRRYLLALFLGLICITHSSIANNLAVPPPTEPLLAKPGTQLITPERLLQISGCAGSCSSEVK